jgi:hypothetical protein
MKRLKKIAMSDKIKFVNTVEIKVHYGTNLKSTVIPR